MADRNVEVLVVGGGGSGLTASIMLASLGVDSLAIERHPSTSNLPKAHILNVRTMEIFDQLGIADEIYALGTPAENLAAATWYTSLGGDEPWERKRYHRVDAWGGGALSSMYAEATAYRIGNLPQRSLEPVLRRHAEQRTPSGVLFNHELESFTQDDDGVTCIILDRKSSKRSSVRASYVVGADGGKMVGRALGVEMVGPTPFVNMISIVFEADLSPYLEEDDSVIRMIARPTLSGGWIRGGCVSMGPSRWDRHSEQWRVNVTLPIGEGAGKDQDDERAVHDVRRQLGLPNLELKVLTVNRWVVESVLADRYAVGRVFLAGDAAHRHSQHGGLGLNTGIQDVHNLTWKLAAVLKGYGAPALLDSYEVERRPVGQRNVEWSTFNFHNHLATGAGFGVLLGAPEAHNRKELTALFSDTLDGENRRARLREFYGALRREFQQLDVELGFNYGDSPVVVSDGSVPPPRDPVGHVHHQTARPGHRLPHAWLERGGKAMSTHHLLQPGSFLLLAGPKGEAWCKAATSDDRIKILAHRIGAGCELTDRDGAWQTLRGHGDDGAVLVRPDGHVAFRATAAHPNAAHIMAAVVRVATGHATGLPERS